MTEEIIRRIVREEIQGAFSHQLMNKREAADFLGICYRTLESNVKAGVIKAVMIGGRTMFRRSDLLSVGRVKYSGNLKKQ